MSYFNADGQYTGKYTGLSIKDKGQQYNTPNYTPTASEVVSKILTVGQQDRERGRQLYNLYEQTASMPSSPFYDPYKSATNASIAGISSYGIDVSGGITNDWINQNSWLKDHYRLGASGTPLAPSSKSTQLENAAYNFYKIYNAETDTMRAENELAAMQNEIEYWVGRGDRNYSDAEIMAKIDFAKYPTLAKAQEMKDKGLSMAFNRPIAYNSDTVNGMIYQARNGVKDEDFFTSAIKYQQGKGVKWQENEEITSKLTPQNPNYNPYSVGSTFDEAGVYFGENSFDQKWIEDNAHLAYSEDPKSKALYAEVVEAEAFTQQAINDVQNARNDIDAAMQYGNDIDYELTLIKARYPSLRKLDESLKNGDIVPTTQAINYKWDDLVQYATEQKDKVIQQAAQDPYEAQVISAMGHTPVVPSEHEKAIQANEKTAIDEAGATIQAVGTPKEQSIWKKGITMVQEFLNAEQMIKAVKEVKIDPNARYNATIQSADKHAANHYAKARGTIVPYEEVEKERIALGEELYALNQQYDELTAYVPPSESTAPKRDNYHTYATINGKDYEFYIKKSEDGKYVFEYAVDGYDGKAPKIYNNANANTGGTGVYSADGEEEVDFFAPPDLDVIAKGQEIAKRIDGASSSPKRSAAPAPAPAIVHNTGEYSSDGEEEVDLITADMVKAEIDAVTDKLASCESYLMLHGTEYNAAKDVERSVQNGYKTAEAMRIKSGIDKGNGYNLPAVIDYALTYFQEYEPTQWMAYTQYDTDPNGGVNLAQNAKKQGETAIEQLESVLETLNVNGVAIDENVKTNIQRAIDAQKRNITDADYFLLRGKEDFDTVVTDTKAQIQNAVDSHKWYNFINPYDGYSNLDVYAVNPLLDFSVNTGSTTHMNTLTDNERDTYLYILGTAGEEEAKKYYDHLNDPTYGVVSVRESDNATKVAQQAAEQNPALATLMTVATSPMAIAGAGYAAYAGISGKEVNPYHGAFGATNINSTMRKTVKKELTDEFGEGSTGDFLSNLGYDVITGAGDSVVAALFGGGTAVGAVALQASNAASSTVQDAKLRGATDQQAYLLGGASFLAESLTEYIPMDTLLKFDGAAKTVKSMLVNAGKQFLSEGIGEGASEALGQASDAVIMKEISAIEQAKQSYIDNGYTEAQAKEKATKDILYQVAYSSLVGGLSGTASIAASYTKNTITPNKPQAQGTQGVEDTQDNPQDAKEAIEGDITAIEAQDTQEAQSIEAVQDDTIAQQSLLLQEAISSDRPATVTSALSAVLAPQDAVQETIETVAPAIDQLQQEHGEKLTNTVQHILTLATTTGQDIAPVKNAIVLAGLHPTGATATAFKRMVAIPQNIDAYSLTTLADIATKEATLPQAQQAIDNTIVENMVANRVQQLIGDGALAGVAPYQMALKQSIETTSNARQMLQTKQSEYKAIAQNLQSVTAQYRQAPANQMLRGAVLQATKDVKGAMTVVHQYQQAHDTAVVAESTAKSNLERMQQDSMKRVRKQASDEVNQLRESKRAQKSNQEENSTQKLEGNAQGNIEQNASVTPKKATKKLKSPAKIAKDLSKALHVGDSIGTRKMNQMPRAVLGYYDNHSQYIAIRPNYAGEYRVGMHELFHHLQHTLGMTGTQQMIDKLPNEFKENYADDKLAGEAFAEFGWRYMESDVSARDFAGEEFVNAFDRQLKERGFYDTVQKAALDLRMWQNANVNDQIGATIHKKSERQKKSIREHFRDFIVKMVDDTAAAEVVDHKIREQDGKGNVRNMALMKNFAARRSFYILTENLTDIHGNIIGDSLATRFEKAGITASNKDLLQNYMLALHSLDRDRQGKPVFADSISKEKRIEFIEDTKKNHPEIVKGEQAFQEFRKDFFNEFLVKTGFLKEADFAHMNDMYPHYAPTYRVQDAKGAKKGGKDAKYAIKNAKGSTQDMYAPMDSFVDMVNTITTMVIANNAALEFHKTYVNYEGMGEFGRDITPDMKKASVDMTAIQQEVGNMLSETDIDEDVFKRVLDLIGTRQEQWQQMQGSRENNVLSVQLPNGEVALYQLYDDNLYRLLTSQRDGGVGVLKAIGKLTRGVSAMLTSNNPLFGGRNLMRDFQSSVNHGSWASNYFSATGKWLAAAYDVWTRGGVYEEYAALGGGGWTRIEAGTKKGNNEYNQALFRKRYFRNANLGKKAQWVAEKACKAITLERLNEVIEQASRVAEYKHGKHDTTTNEGKMEAFLAGQEVTTDFSRTGGGATASVLKQIIPFYSASLQGIYRTGRMLTEKEIQRAPQRFGKIFFNTALASTLSAAMIMKYSKDEEKESFALLRDEMKATHFYLPNFGGIMGDAPFIRIPIAQEPLVCAINGLVTNLLWSGETDGAMIELSAIANTILDDLNLFSGGSIFRALIDAGKNETWYGSPIVPQYMENWDPTTQYTAETPSFIVDIGRWTNTSPLKIEYLMGQYTGFLGQLALPFLQKDATTGEKAGGEAILKEALKKFTSDPYISNDVIGSFYDGYNFLNSVVLAGRGSKPLNMLSRDMTDDETTQAYERAYDLTHSGGSLYEAKKQISTIYDEIDAINANATLSDKEKYQLTTEKRKEMIAIAQTAQQDIAVFKEDYVTGMNFVTNLLSEGKYVRIPTAVEALPDVFSADMDKPYMTQAVSLWEETGNDSVLPHPNEFFTATDKGTGISQTYIIEDEHWDEYCSQYKQEYERILGLSANEWRNGTNDTRIEIAKSAHNKAHTRAKEWYAYTMGIGL